MAEFLEVMKHRKRMCDALKKTDCSSCGLCSDNNNYNVGCSTFIYNYYEQAEEIIMKWAKEHPVMTNADKFKEVFGFTPDGEYCPKECPENGCINCDYRYFWNQEYKESKGETNGRTKE